MRAKELIEFASNTQINHQVGENYDEDGDIKQRKPQISVCDPAIDRGPAVDREGEAKDCEGQRESPSEGSIPEQQRPQPFAVVVENGDEESDRDASSPEDGRKVWDFLMSTTVQHCRKL
jgi:hypothetical protein